MNDGGHRNDQLHAASRSGDLPTARQLIADGHDPNAFDEIGKTPLHYAVEIGDIRMAAFLIGVGADVNARDESLVSDTPLAANAQRCTLEMAHLLVESGADPTIRGWMQFNALDRARERKRAEGIEVCRFLETAAEKFKTQQHLAPYGSQARRRRR